MNTDERNVLTMKRFETAINTCDDKLANATVDRIVHHGRLVEFGGQSRRFDEALMMGKSEK